MKIRVAKRDLDNAIQVVQSSMSSTGSDITTHFLFRRREADGKIEILTYNGRVFSSAPVVGAVVEGDAPFTIEGKRLRQWLAATEDAATLAINLVEGSGAEAKVRITAGRGQGTFRSLDPKAFAYWDEALATAKVVANMPAVRLQAALDHVRSFICDDESRTPELCVTEASSGVLRATDRLSASLVQVAGLENSNMRIHVKDVGGILSFLGLFAGGDVEVLESEKVLALRRASDGAVYGESRFASSFPNIQVDKNEQDPHSWTVDRDEFERAIRRLTATADWTETRLTIQWAGAGNPLVLKMRNTSGEEDEAMIDVETAVSADGANPLPAEGFTVAHRNLSKALSSYPEDKVTIGVTQRPKGGYMRFHAIREGDDFLTLVAWLR